MQRTVVAQCKRCENHVDLACTFCTHCVAGIIGSISDLSSNSIRTRGRRDYWSQKARKHASNAHTKGGWTIVARWGGDAGHRKTLLNQGWDDGCIEILQWEREGRNIRSDRWPRGVIRHTGALAFKCAKPSARAPSLRARWNGPHKKVCVAD